MFSGYMHDAKPLNSGSNNSDYNMVSGGEQCDVDMCTRIFFHRYISWENATT